MSAVHELFGEFGISRFIEEHLHRLPFALQGTAARVAPIGSWETLARVAAAPDVDLMIVREGARYSADRPRDLAGLQALARDGWTTLVRHAERHDAAIAELAAGFAQEFLGPVDVHLYFTPGGRYGFSWHYDAEDVFILQTAGEKNYALRKNTVHPWPLEETLPTDMKYERELMPLMQARLRAGDLLYIPCGYWHRAEAAGGDSADDVSISLAVGVTSRAAIDILDALRPRLVESIVWRQRLPLGAGGATDHYRMLLATLADDLTRTLLDPEVQDAMVKQFSRGA